MQLLRILRHGPLVFWIVVSAALVGTLYAASSSVVGDRPAVSSPAADQRAVEAWRAQLIALPNAAALDMVADLAAGLAQTAVTNATAVRTSNPTLAAAWDHAAATARQLGRVDTADDTAVFDAIRAVGLAGDALAAALDGIAWTLPAPEAPTMVGSPDRIDR